MYKCEDCECVFEDANTVTEYRGECHGSPAYEEYAVCPMCNSTDFQDFEEKIMSDFYEVSLNDLPEMLKSGATVYMTDRLTLITYDCFTMPKSKYNEAMADTSNRFNFYTRRDYE